jgi:hypothetical protein
MISVLAVGIFGNTTSFANNVERSDQMIKFRSGKYEVEYINKIVNDIYLTKTQRRAFNQDLMQDLGIRSLRPKEDIRTEYFKGKILTGIFLLSILLWAIPCFAWTNEQIANAIYKAENSKAHPYGILAHYKHTTPRTACLNTIRHARRDWNGQGDFISFLGHRYCPVGCNNDNGTNRYWIKNVKYFLERDNI